MKQAIVTLWGRYKYKILLDGNESLHDLAMKISLAVHTKEGKTKFTGKPRSYNYIYEALLRKTCLNVRINTQNSINTEQEMIHAANELNSKSEFVKVPCVPCPKCNNHGFVYEKQNYRLGYTQAHTLIIDIDGKNTQNLTDVKEFYESVLNCIFIAIETKHGYWLFSDKKYGTKIDSWIYDHCRILNPDLGKDKFIQYKSNLLGLDMDTHGNFRQATPEIIRSSGLYTAPDSLKFDIAFTFLSIKRQRSTIRYSKKSKDDFVKQIDFTHPS